MSTTPDIKSLELQAAEAIESGDPADAKRFAEASGMQPGAFQAQLQAQGGEQLALAVQAHLDQQGKMLNYTAQELNTLALIATGRSGGALKEAPFKEAGLLNDAKDGWTDLTAKGEAVLRSAGYDLDPKRGWQLAAHELQGSVESAAARPPAPAEKFRVLGAHPNRNFFDIEVEAIDGQHAFGVAALLLKEADEEGEAEFFAAIPAATRYVLPGESVVTLDTVLDPEQADVFGLAEPVTVDDSPSPGM